MAGSTAADSGRLSSWIDEVIGRHRAGLTSTEFLKAVRALSGRYVEQRHTLSERSAIDSRGKRAAFAGFFAPIHFLTVRAVMKAMDITRLPVRQIVDAGCGTGSAGAAFSLSCAPSASVLGIDRDSWALAETAWNWKQLGIAGRTRRGDLVRVVRDHTQALKEARGPAPAFVFGWSINELDTAQRSTLLTAVRTLAIDGTTVLIVEPLAHRATPWWPEWTRELTPVRARIDEWKFPLDLPGTLAELDEAAGFRRENLSAKTIWIAGR